MTTVWSSVSMLGVWKTLTTSPSTAPSEPSKVIRRAGRWRPRRSAPSPPGCRTTGTTTRSEPADLVVHAAACRAAAARPADRPDRALHVGGPRNEAPAERPHEVGRVAQHRRVRQHPRLDCGLDPRGDERQRAAPVARQPLPAQVAAEELHARRRRASTLADHLLVLGREAVARRAARPPARARPRGRRPRARSARGRRSWCAGSSRCGRRSRRAAPGPA